MVHLTPAEKKLIATEWGELNHVTVTAKSLERLFVVYPWTKKHFAVKFKDHFKATDSCVVEHAKKVAGALETAVTYIDDVKPHYKELSKKHEDLFLVDSENFQLLASCMLIELGHTFKEKFAVDVHVAWNKFLKVVVDALSAEYH